MLLGTKLGKLKRNHEIVTIKHLFTEHEFEKFEIKIKKYIQIGQLFTFKTFLLQLMKGSSVS